MSDYNGDTEEDVAMFNAYNEYANDPMESLPGIEAFVACDYFQWGWDAAMKYIRSKDE